MIANPTEYGKVFKSCHRYPPSLLLQEDRDANSTLTQSWPQNVPTPSGACKKDSGDSCPKSLTHFSAEGGSRTLTPVKGTGF